MSWLVVSLIVTGCAADRGAPLYPNLGGSQYPNVGLYTPGSTLGLSQGSQTAADAGADAAPAAAMGDRCVGAPGSSDGTPGTLTVDFMTQIIGERWKPANVGAVWIEDAAGAYIKTIELWAGLRIGSLYRWHEHACTAAWPEVDVVTAATRPNHDQPHHSVWKGKDLNGKLVPDGIYQLFIEVTETELNYGPLVMYQFEKGRNAQMLEPPDKPAHKGLKISYAPSAD